MRYAIAVKELEGKKAEKEKLIASSQKSGNYVNDLNSKLASLESAKAEADTKRAGEFFG